MLDKVPIRTPPGAQLIACPPKHQARPADPCALVIFGATGDLTKRLVVPALYNLSRSKVLPEQFALIGVARSDGTADSWRERLHDMLKSFVGHAGSEFNTDHIDEDAWARLADAMTYISGDLTKPDLYEDVRAALDEAEKAARGRAFGHLSCPRDCGHGLWRARAGSFGRTPQALFPADDYRNFSARFQGENLRSNLDLAERLRASAIAMHATPA